MNELPAIRDRLDSADAHIEQVKIRLRTYYGSQKYDITGDFDPDATSISYFFGELITGPPLRLGTLAGEVLHDLRSCLDHLAWEMVEEETPGNATVDTRFPILKVPPTANNQGISPPPYVAGGVSETALELIEREQPYQLGADFGADSLYVLHALNNIDKHRHVTIRGVQSEASYLAGQPGRFTFTARLASASEYGAEIEYVPDDPSVDVHFGTTLQVRVHEVDPGISLPLLDALVDASKRVRSIVEDALQTCFT
jgi:hypothetical protein